MICDNVIYSVINNIFWHLCDKAVETKHSSTKHWLLTCPSQPKGREIKKKLADSTQNAN